MRELFGVINGWQNFVLAGSRSLAPVPAGAADIVAGGYIPVIRGFAVISLASAVALLRVTAPPAR